jgi:RHS repeat-associated protein
MNRAACVALLVAFGCGSRPGLETIGQVTQAEIASGQFLYGFDPSGLSTSIGTAGSSYAIARKGSSLTAGADTYTFDALGRVSAIDASSIAYGPDGQIDHVTRGAGTLSYVYDEAGQRILKSTNGVPTAAFVDGAYVAATELDEPVRVGGRIVGLLRNGVFALVATDMRGTVQADTDGTPRAASPFGARTTHPDVAAAVDYAERGFDADLGAQRMGVRDYDSRIARFLQPDPLFLLEPDRCVKSPGECNLYGYARNQPADFRDPSGTQAEPTEPTPPSTRSLDDMLGKVEPTTREEALELVAVSTAHDVFHPGDAIEWSPGPPGTKQSSADAAAYAALRFYATRSYYENREYAGLVYRNSDSSYSFTPGARGYRANSYPDNAADHVPTGAHVVADYHTHGGPDPHYNGEAFSKDDAQSAKDLQRPGYVGTPGAHFGVIYPTLPGTKLNAVGTVCGFWCDFAGARER